MCIKLTKECSQDEHLGNGKVKEDREGKKRERKGKGGEGRGGKGRGEKGQN